MRYASSCRFQGRGVKPLDTKLTSAGLPDLASQIEERLNTHACCKLLEVGCGEGRLLLELLEKFGSRVELHGLNHPDWPMIAGESPLHRTNEHYEILHPLRLLSLPLPKLHAADVQDLSAFPVRDFDFIISQAVLPHVPDKARALEQMAALLAPDGMLAHELDCVDLPPLDFLDTDLPRLTIYRGTQRISASEHLRAAGVEILSCQRTGVKGVGLLAVYHAAEQPLCLGLELERGSTLQLHSIAACDVPLKLWGVRSVYRVAAS
jgi:SAM-dependent methyltransferase